MKQVIVIRKDLNMRKGKIASQAAHASMAAIFNLSKKTEDGILIKYTSEFKKWFEDKFTKITVYVESEKELLEVYSNAISHGLNASLIKDAGLTEFNGIPTLTCLCIGPHENEKFINITDHLKLL
jgi:PTH2 family peptidyl-tRNA hydrolase